MSMNIFCTNKSLILRYDKDRIDTESEGKIGLLLRKAAIKINAQTGRLLPGSTLTRWSYSSCALCVI